MTRLFAPHSSPLWTGAPRDSKAGFFYFNMADQGKREMLQKLYYIKESLQYLVQTIQSLTRFCLSDCLLCVPGTCTLVRVVCGSGSRCRLENHTLILNKVQCNIFKNALFHSVRLLVMTKRTSGSGSGSNFFQYAESGSGSALFNADSQF